MNTFVKAFDAVSNMTTTENGCGAYKNTKSALVDFFFTAGSMGFNSTPEAMKTLYSKFVDAFNEAPKYAIVALFWLRDIRGGAGQRSAFRYIVKNALNNDSIFPYIAGTLNLIPEYGRWDDLWSCGTVDHKRLHEVLSIIIYNNLYSPETAQLVAKWLPREGASQRNGKVTARQLMNILGLSPKEYRKICSSRSADIVEVKMSAKKWDEIKFEHVPSIAMSKYTNAFMRNCDQRFTKYKKDLVEGNTKVNAAALYPYQVIASVYEYNHGSAEIAEAQWKALPDFIPEGLSFMPVVDTSGSMYTKIGKVQAIDVAVSLGIYLAERQKSVFKNKFITFSGYPSLETFFDEQSLLEKICRVKNSDWGMNTDIHKVVDLILDIAKKFSVPAEDMPNSLIILSDMQFDQAAFPDTALNPTFLDSAKTKYANAGYEFPHIVFWNLTGNMYSNAPATCDIPGISMVSGFSPSIMQYILQGKEVTPLDQVMEIVMSDRYKRVLNALP